MDQILNLYFSQTFISYERMSVIFILIVLSALLSISFLEIGKFPRLFRNLIKLPLIAVALITFISTDWARVILNDNYAATLDKSGISLKGYGSFDWKDVQKLYTYSIPDFPMEIIGIKLKQNVSLSKECSIFNKFRVSFSKKFESLNTPLPGLGFVTSDIGLA